MLNNSGLGFVWLCVNGNLTRHKTFLARDLFISQVNG